MTSHIDLDLGLSKVLVHPFIHFVHVLSLHNFVS